MGVYAPSYKYPGRPVNAEKIALKTRARPGAGYRPSCICLSSASTLFISSP
jgi:hypothetical protein